MILAVLYRTRRYQKMLETALKDNKNYLPVLPRGTLPSVMLMFYLSTNNSFVSSDTWPSTASSSFLPRDFFILSANLSFGFRYDFTSSYISSLCFYMDFLTSSFVMTPFVSASLSALANDLFTPSYNFLSAGSACPCSSPSNSACVSNSTLSSSRINR